MGRRAKMYPHSKTHPVISLKFPTGASRMAQWTRVLSMYDDELYPQNPQGGGTDSLKLVLSSTRVSRDMYASAHDVMQFKFLSNSSEMSLWILSESVWLL